MGQFDKVEQKDRTKTLAEFPDHNLNDYALTDDQSPQGGAEHRSRETSQNFEK